MPSSIDRKTTILIILALCAAALTVIREHTGLPTSSTPQRAVEEGPPRKELSAIIDSTLKQMGVPPVKIRRTKVSVGEIKGVRDELRVAVPPGFDVIRMLTSLTDSLRRFDVSLVSTENLKEKTSSIHLSYDKRVFESIVLSKQVQQKGATPSGSRSSKGTRRKVPR